MRKYQFEIYDITALLTILNVAFIILVFHIISFSVLINCLIFIVLNIKNKGHINGYITQLSLIILNAYFFLT